MQACVDLVVCAYARVLQKLHEVRVACPGTEVDSKFYKVMEDCVTFRARPKSCLEAAHAQYLVHSVGDRSDRRSQLTTGDLTAVARLSTLPAATHQSHCKTLQERSEYTHLQGLPSAHSPSLKAASHGHRQQKMTHSL